MPPPSRVYDVFTVVCTAAQVLRRAALIHIKRKTPPSAYVSVSTPSTPPGGSVDSLANPLGDLTTGGRQSAQSSISQSPDDIIKPNTWTYVQPKNHVSRSSSHNTLDLDAPSGSDSHSSKKVSPSDDFNYYEETEVCDVD